MLKKFLDHIERENLCNSDAGILLAVSGGMDSMVMLDLFVKSDYRIAVAHFNHVTRNGASDRDEEFVRAYCKKHELVFYSKRLDVKSQYPSDNFQERARVLRYQFFKTLCQENKYAFIATAHHLDDQLESFLINYARGAGLTGLTGIKLKREQLIRPMMFCGVEEIKFYQKQNQLPFVEDASNATQDYLRNRIRHKVVPPLKEAFPSLITQVSKNQQNLTGDNQLLLHFVSKWKELHVVVDNTMQRISKEAINNLPSRLALCHYLFAPYGFKRDQLIQLLASITEVGLNFYSTTHRILVDRNELILTEIEAKKLVDKFIDLGANKLGSINLDLNLVEEKQFETSRLVELVDMDKLVFPLRIRNWEAGDRLMPLGMSGQYQKVKDLLINTKISQYEKEKVLVLISDGEIVWVIGHRLDQRFSLGPDSKRFLKLSYKTE